MTPIRMNRVLILSCFLCVTPFVHAAPLLDSVVTDAAAGEGAPVTSLPIIVDADGHPLGISLSEARHIVALDGHAFVALSTAANVTLTLKITAPDGLIDTSFITSRLMGKELLTGSTSECLYQVTLVGDNGGQGIVNLCDNLSGYVYTSECGYSIVQAPEALHEVTVIPTALPKMPPLTEANKGRSVRSVVKQRYIELLVVADYTTLQWHAGQDVESYIVTLIDLASRVLKDSSLGQAIEVVLKKLVILEQPDPGLKLVPNVDLSEKRFIKWKKAYEKNADERYDLALLLTRVNLKYGSIDHTGLATTGGICHADQNCILVEDGGLTSSYTIAHEIGHSLGLGHDGEGDNNCTDRPYVMSAVAYTSAQSPLWSPCSQSKLDELLRYEPYPCLDNKPTTFSSEHSKSLTLPGEKYSRDKQCQLRHGPTASSCDIEDQCTMLWCQLPGRSCMTNQMSVADGTPCTITNSSDTGVCMNRQCGPAVNLAVVDGQWGAWSDWTNCSRTCGVGVAHSERFCDSPKPSNGGSYCTGEQRRYRTCNIQDCPDEENIVNFRDEQCKSYGAKWRALDEDIQLSRTPCKLHCKAEGTFNEFPAADGTWCKAGSLDMCIAGRCVPIGCDRQLWSNATVDHCGVCSGNGSTCVEKSGTQKLKHLGINRIAVVPKGALKVIIREKESTTNYIVAADNHGMLFNGSSVRMTHEVTKVHFSGLDWEYGRPQNAPEYLMANGPSIKDVTVAVFAEEHCRGIEYSYLAPVDTVEPVETTELYSWHYTFWSPCSVTCGQGVSISNARCFDSQEKQVSAKHCKGLPKLKRQKRKCSLPNCPTTDYDWHYTQWSDCSATCGGGVRTRTVQCMKSGVTPLVVNASLCSKKAPASSKDCGKKPCPFSWSHSDWSNCSARCGMGHMTRIVKCNDAHGNVVDDEKCTADIKPAVVKQCYKDGEHCQLLWKHTAWSKCSVTCGVGMRIRMPQCVYLNGTAAATSLCDEKLGPAPAVDRELCNTDRDCSENCRDSNNYKDFCPMVKSNGFCHMENLRQQCCETCSKTD